MNTAYKEDAPAGRNARPQADQRIRCADSGAGLEYIRAPFPCRRPQIADGLERRGFEFEIGRQVEIAEQSLKTKGAHHHQILPRQVGLGDRARIGDLDGGSAGREEACQQVGANQLADAGVRIVGRPRSNVHFAGELVDAALPLLPGRVDLDVAHIKASSGVEQRHAESHQVARVRLKEGRPELREVGRRGGRHPVRGLRRRTQRQPGGARHCRHTNTAGSSGGCSPREQPAPRPQLRGSGRTARNRRAAARSRRGRTRPPRRNTSPAAYGAWLPAPGQCRRRAGRNPACAQIPGSRAGTPLTHPAGRRGSHAPQIPGSREADGIPADAGSPGAFRVVPGSLRSWVCRGSDRTQRPALRLTSW